MHMRPAMHSDVSRAPNGLTDRGKLRSCERAEARRGKILDVSDRGGTKARDANPRFPDGSQTIRCSRHPPPQVHGTGGLTRARQTAEHTRKPTCAIALGGASRARNTLARSGAHALLRAVASAHALGEQIAGAALDDAGVGGAHLPGAVADQGRATIGGVLAGHTHTEPEHCALCRASSGRSPTML
jgi:hypothetical protein